MGSTIDASLETPVDNSWIPIVPFFDLYRVVSENIGLLSTSVSILGIYKVGENLVDPNKAEAAIVEIRKILATLDQSLKDNK